MDDLDIFELYEREKDNPKNEIEELSIEEVIELKKRELLEQEEKEKREAERKKQAFIKAKKDKKYKEYSTKVELLYKWMIGFALFAVISAGYWYYKDYFFLTVQGGLLFTGPTKVLGKAIISTHRLVLNQQ